MPGKDYQDWGGYPSGAGAYIVKDLGELAARLGSPVVYSRSGAVAFIEDFEYGLNKWLLGQTGSGNNPVLSAAVSLSKGFSAKLDPGTTLNDSTSLWIKQPLPPAGKWGFSYRWQCEKEPQFFYIRMYVIVDEVAYDFMVRYRASDDALQVRDTGGTYQTIATVGPVHFADSLWHFLKLVIDFESKTYVRLHFDANEYDLSAYTLAGSAFASQDRISLTAIIYSNGATMTPFYIDDFIFTYNEP